MAYSQREGDEHPFTLGTPETDLGWLDLRLDRRYDRVLILYA